jgi:acyl-coenzyme A synthetase/AMP-(fatty) acid ligase
LSSFVCTSSRQTTDTVYLTRCRTNISILRGENISSITLEPMLVQYPSVLEAGVVPVPDSN